MSWCSKERERDEVEMMMMKGDEDGCEEGKKGFRGSLRGERRRD